MLINGWIIVKFEKEEKTGKTLEEFTQIIIDKAIDNILLHQLNGLRNNLNSFTQDEKKKMFEFVKGCNSPNPNHFNFEIKL